MPRAVRLDVERSLGERKRLRTPSPTLACRPRRSQGRSAGQRIQLFLRRRPRESRRNKDSPGFQDILDMTGRFDPMSLHVDLHCVETCRQMNQRTSQQETKEKSARPRRFSGP